VIGVDLSALTYTTHEGMLMGRNVIGICLTALTFAIHEGVGVGWNIIRICLTAFTFSIHERMSMNRVIRENKLTTGHTNTKCREK
jgi:hypothetical protein